jgi:hypothetical protein
MAPLPPLTKADLRKALDAIWHKAPNELRPDIDALCDAIKERGVGEMVNLAAGSMIPPLPPPPPSAHAATDDDLGTERG